MAIEYYRQGLKSISLVQLNRKASSEMKRDKV